MNHFKTEVHETQIRLTTSAQSMRVLAAEAELSIITDSYRCQYPSKRCTSERSVKRDGDLHKLCEFHRSRANRNQQKLEQKRKLEARLKGGASATSPTCKTRRQGEKQTSFSSCVALADDDDECDDDNAPWEFLEDLDDEDLHVLASLLEVSDS